MTDTPQGDAESQQGEPESSEAPADPNATPSADDPAPSVTPEVTPSPEASVDPDASATPEASVTPEASPTPSPTPTINPDATPMPGEDDDAIEQDELDPDAPTPLKIQMSVKPGFAKVGQNVVWSFTIESEREPEMNWYLYKGKTLLKSGKFVNGERSFEYQPGEAGVYSFKLVAKVRVGEGENASQVKIAKEVKLTVISASDAPSNDPPVETDVLWTVAPNPSAPLSVDVSLEENTVVIGEEAVWHYAVQSVEKAEIVWQLFKDGYELGSGVYDSNVGSYNYTPSELGIYAFRLTAVTQRKAADDSEETITEEKSKVCKLQVTEPPELTVEVSAHASYCFGGDSMTFGLKHSDNRYAEAANTHITVRQAGMQIYESYEFKESVRVWPEVLDEACTLELTVEMEDQFGQRAKASVEVPCPMHETENRYTWQQTLKDVKLTGNWPQDILAVAKSQLGYKESQKDFIIRDDGERQGWSRYGAWYGMPYEEWCSMFVSFCLENANVPEWAVPQSASQQRLRSRLINQGLYAAREDAEPRPGDLIFFDHETETWENGYGATDHIGIVLAVDDERVYTIEGNSNIRVREREYLLTDEHITGYGLVNLVYEANHPEPEDEISEEDKPEEDVAEDVPEEKLPKAKQPNKGQLEEKLPDGVNDEPVAPDAETAALPSPSKAGKMRQPVTAEGDDADSASDEA